MASSSGMQRADEVMAKLGKARVKKSATNWGWEDELHLGKHLGPAHVSRLDGA